MVVARGDGASSGVFTAMRPPWFDQYVVGIPRVQHDLLKNPKMVLPNFDPDNKEETPEYFMYRFMLSL